jgi:hypothetical protein
MTSAIRPLAAFLACALLACSNSTANTTPPKDDLETKNYANLASCRGSASTTDIDNNVELALDLRESLHEMVVCGGLTATLAGSVIGVLIDAIQGNTTDPGGFTFDGKGGYTSDQMDVQFFLGADTSFGKAGELITFNVFDASNYVTGISGEVKASVDLSGNATTSATLSFMGTGQGVELLGLGKSPASPIKLDTNALLNSIGKIQIESKIHVDDTQAHGKVNYQMKMDKVALSKVVNGYQQTIDLLALSGGRADLNQTAKIDAFTITFGDVGNHSLTGTVHASISGGTFPFDVLYSYPRRAEPDVVLGCPGATLVPPDGGAAGTGGTGGTSGGFAGTGGTGGSSAGAGGSSAGVGGTGN